ncbi:hypothetical protein DEM27_15685 [Metarhizobium album]|uniref:PepSY domain-containing protein n=1 Tax=Metarhizobium album TaxID=2182425 RepID=A0A2U2DQD8_9HYPH|nr:hypothetical protein [Rhizobium album]PWE55492.1 hypothetical protein DEM27_15685 [Rhizobium album]
MRKVMIVLLAAASAGTMLVTTQANAARGDQGGGRGEGNKSIERIRSTWPNERVRWVRSDGKCSFERIRVFDGHGNSYFHRVKVCDRDRYIY